MMSHKIFKIVLFEGLVLLALFVVSIALQRELPAPAGQYTVGQTVIRWVDSSRQEVLSDDPHDFREVVAFIWYPAEGGTGIIRSYIPNLSIISNSLIESGEVESWKVLGLKYIRSHNLWNAKPATSDTAYPVVIFSPGNGTNVEFYTVLLSELASHGYIVVGLNHPYDVAAVELSNHKVAAFYTEQNTFDRNANEAFIAERIKVRTQDVLFVLKQLETLDADPNGLFAHILNLDSVAVAGHSLGGITASEACKADAHIRACLNLDGIQRGGPFSTDVSTIPPDQPFLFLTKDSQLPSKLIEKFESMKESYWVVIQGATHDSFTDGAILQPGLLPISNRADQIMSLVENYTLAFLDQQLKRQPSSLLSESEDLQGVTVKVYPSK